MSRLPGLRIASRWPPCTSHDVLQKIPSSRIVCLLSGASEAIRHHWRRTVMPSSATLYTDDAFSTLLSVSGLLPPTITPKITTTDCNGLQPFYLIACDHFTVALATPATMGVQYCTFFRPTIVPLTDGAPQSEAQWLDEKRYSTVPPSWQASRAQR